MKNKVWKVVPLAIFMMLSFFLWRGLSLDPHHVPSAQLGKLLPEFTLPLLQNPELVFKSAQLRHKVVLLNVWASWCQACVEEQVFLLQLARKGVPIYGLNYKDDPQDARLWLAQWGNPYQQIAKDVEGKAAIDLGVYGAPETFVIDKQGMIRYRHVGVLDEKVWSQVVQPLMKQLEQQS